MTESKTERELLLTPEEVATIIPIPLGSPHFDRDLESFWWAETKRVLLAQVAKLKQAGYKSPEEVAELVKKAAPVKGKQWGDR